VGRDRGRAGVAADGECHLHWVFGPGQIGALRLRLEGVSQRVRGLDNRLQPHAVDDAVEGERSVLTLTLVLVALVLVLSEGARRDGGGEGADLECDRLGNGIDPGRGAAQGEAGLKFKAILVWLAIQVDLELGVESKEGHPHRRRHNAPRHRG